MLFTFGKHTDPWKPKINQKTGLTTLFPPPSKQLKLQAKGKSDLKNVPTARKQRQNRLKHTSSPEQKKTST